MYGAAWFQVGLALEGGDDAAQLADLEVQDDIYTILKSGLRTRNFCRRQDTLKEDKEEKMVKSKWTAALSVLMVFSIVLAACGPTAEPISEIATQGAEVTQVVEKVVTATPEPAEEKVVAATPELAEEKILVIALGADSTGLDPESVMNNESAFVMSTIYDGVTRFNKGTTEVGPGLAEKWDVSPDGLEYTFYLRKGVKFHDGTDWNADAMVYEVRRITDPTHPYYVHGQEGIQSYADFTWSTVTKAEKVDEYTVKLTLSEAYAPFLANLAMAFTGMVSPASVEKYGYDIMSNPVGTGPFKFVEWVRNDHVTLEANPDYWDGAPKVDKLIFRIVPESGIRLLMLEQGEVHILADVSPDDYERIKANPDLVLLEQPGLTVNGLELPCDAPILSDVRVRQALNYAVNKDEMNEFLYNNAAVTEATGMPPILWGYPKDLQPYSYDPEKAKQLLAEAGYPDGFKAKILCYENPRGYNAVGIKMAVAIQEYLAAVGVDVELETLEWGAFLQAIRTTENMDMGMTGWSGDNGDPDNFLNELFSSTKIPLGNTSHYRNAEVDDLLWTARTTLDQSERAKLYEKAATIIHDDAPWLFVNHTLHVRAHRAEIEGFVLNPLQMFFYMEDVGFK
jgi:peptide/nickel transport system substrate-binding protein